MPQHDEARRIERNIKSDRDETLIFLHIPKTGGSTLNKILEQQYARSASLILHQPKIDSFRTLSDAERSKYRLIQGHMYFGLHRVIPNPSSYITFLRRPIERVVSFYYYARSTPDHYLYPLLSTERVDLKTLLMRDVTVELRNDQTRVLAGDDWSDQRRPVTPAALQRAKENLRRHFRIVGLQEEFDASLLLSRRAFDWRLPFYLKENVTKKKPTDASLDVETRRLVEDANSLDLELYEYARTLFEEQCRAAGESFAAELAHFRQLNRERARLLPRIMGSVRRVFRSTPSSRHLAD